MGGYHLGVRVYVEVVIFNNLCVDLLLILSTLTLRRSRASKLRVGSAVIVGAAAATLYPIVPRGFAIAIRALLAPLMTAIFYKPKKGKFPVRAADHMLTLFIFAALTFFLGGATEGISRLLGIDINSYATLGGIALALVMMLAAVRGVIFSKARARDVRTVTLYAMGASVKCRALADSGNLLVDNFSGLPVIMISGELEKRLGHLPTEGYIDVNTVSGSSRLRLVKIDSVSVDGERRKAMGAVSDFIGDGLDVILQANMFSGA